MGEPEVQYVALRNIQLIVQKRPGILAADVKMFFCKYNDPVYVKLEKVDIMVMLVSDKNFEQVLLELKEYSTGVDVDFVRKSVRSIGRVAVKLERACERTISVLLELIDTKVNYVVQEAAVVIKDIFRKYPSRYEQVLQALCESLEVLDEPEAKASMIWILGEYAERIDNVESLLDDFLANFHDEPIMVQMQILTGVVKLFLKKPSTTQDMVSKVLRCATEETNNYDLRDRGYIYWRLLSSNPEATKHVVLGDKPGIKDESQTIDKGLLDRLMSELSNMSSVYHKSADEFVTRIVTNTEGAELQEDEDVEFDADDRAARRREVQEEIEKDEREPNRRRDDIAPSGGGGGGGGGLDLLDLDGPEPSAPAPVSIQKIPVLAPNTPGQGGKNGFGIQAALKREGGQIQLLLTFSNTSPMPIGGFAIQVNKNPFGLGPAAALAAADIAPGSTADLTLPMQPGVLSNAQPPSNPVFLQVAIKNTLDVFYFNIPYELPIALMDGPGLDRDRFSAVWQGVGEGRQSASEGSAASPLNDEVVKQRLAMDNIFYVAKRNVDNNTTHIYLAATTVATNWVIAAELSLRAGSPSTRLAVRTEVPALVPLFEATVCKRLGISR